MTAEHKAPLLWIMMATATLLGACYSGADRDAAAPAPSERQDRTSAQRAIGEYNDAFLIPGSSGSVGRIGDRLRGAAVDIDFLQHSTGEETEEAAVG